MAKAKKEDISLASDPKGLKRICMECGVRFFDLNARPITCPSCSAEFTGEVKVKSKRGRAASVAEATEEDAPKKDVKADKVEEDDEDEEEDDGAEIVSLEDLETPTKGDDDDDAIKVDLDSDDDEDDDLDVDDDIGGLDELEPDADEDEATS